MAFEPVFETINYTCAKKVLTEQLKIEAKADTVAEEIASILNVSAFTTINYAKADDGKIDYAGRVIFYISYLGADGTPAKRECGSEFKGVIKDESVNTSARVFASTVVEKSYADISADRLNAVAFLTVKLEVQSCEQISALSGGENLVVNTDELSYVRSCGVKTTAYPLEEEFQLGYPVAEVLSHRMQAIVSSAQCGVGTVIVDGEVLLSAIMLQKDERNGIIKESKTFPFRVEIECEEAMPNMQATARVKERSFKTDVSVDSDGGLSIVTLSAILDFEAEAYYSDLITVATDAFSTEQEVELVKRDLEYYKAGELKKYTTQISGRSATEELSVGATVLAVGNENVEIIKVSCDDGRTLVNGVLSAVAFIRDGDGKIFTVKLETPFESALEQSFGCDDRLDVVAKAFNGRAKILSLTETELEAEITFTVYPEEKTGLKVIGEVKPLGEKSKNDSALSVYIPMPGEDLWSLAKRLNVCPETLAQTNCDLQFPLTGDERIVIYRQR